MKSKVIIIAGMHRSGTSLVTQWLNRCGLAVGTNLVGPDIGNVQGHFEDEDFLRLNQKLLKKRNLPASGFTNVTPVELSELEKTELFGIIETKSRRQEEWGWKEPRTTLFLSAYHNALPQAFYVVVVRSFNDTVNSIIMREYKMRQRKLQTKKGLSKLKWRFFKRTNLNKIFEKETDKFLKIWVHYYEMILEHLHKLPNNRFVVINHADLYLHDDNVFSKIKDEWTFSLNYVPFKDIYQENLLSEVRDVSQYVKDKSLLSKAGMVEKEMLLNYWDKDMPAHYAILRAV